MPEPGTTKWARHPTCFQEIYVFQGLYICQGIYILDTNIIVKKHVEHIFILLMGLGFSL